MLQKIKSIIQEVSDGMVERESHVEAVFRAILSKQHVLFLGPAGVAKSQTTMKATERVTGATFFKRVMRRDSTCDEVFGPVSLKGLENDVFRRNISGKLPEAHICFLDEVNLSASLLGN